MDLETAQTTTTAKLPILKQDEYDMWRLRIEQYFQLQDYALWDVIENENSFILVAQTTTNADGTSTTLITAPVTTDEMVQKKNDVKARSMLIMTLPNEHLMTFNQYKDAKTLFAAIQTRFCGNEATRKTQKTLLKQMYENFSAPSTKSLDSIFNRLQKINTHVMVWRNKPDLDTISFNDLYNNFKIFEQEKTGRKITINGSDTDGYDKSKVECFNCQKLRHFAKECRQPRNQDSRNRNQDSSRRTVNVEKTASNAMVANDGAGFNLSYMADDEIPTNMALMAFLDSGLDLSNSGQEEFQQPEFEGYRPKTSNNVSEDISNEVKESPDTLLVKELVLNDKLEKKTVFPTVTKIEFIRPKQQEKPVRKPVKYAKMYRSFDHLQANYNYHQRERMVYGNSYAMVNYNYFAKKAHPSAHRNMAPRVVLMKTGLRPLNTARPVNTAHLKTTVYSARPMSRFYKLAQSTIKRPYQQRTTLTNKSFSQKVNTAKGKFYTARPRSVNTARPNSKVVNAVRENQINGHPQKEDQGYVNSGCSRHMTENMSCLSDLEVDGGYVTFRGGAKGGKITSKGTLKTGTKNETSGILKSFITKIENLVDKKVKIIRCDNGTEFKNRVMSEFYKKCIKKEFSVARTPQQNGVAKRRNRTLIKAARTMLADSKLPTQFYAKAINTACYVQNRVLVVKPHNKTSYELFRGRTPALSFMRPFGCHVTILNTLDHLGKFDGKSNDGFFIGYSLNSKAFRVYNIRTRIVEENLHIRFLKNKPIITGHASKEIGSCKDYILLPLWKDNLLFDSFSKNANNDEPQPSNDAGKMNDDGVTKESGITDQERPKNSTQDVNTIGPSINTVSTNVNTGRLNINTVSPSVTTAPLEATYADLFGDEIEVDMSNITTTYLVPSTSNTRIHKDHSLYHVIGDVQSGVQTRRMTKTTSEQGFISVVCEGLYWWIYHMAKGPLEQNGSIKTRKIKEMDVKSAFLFGKIEEEVYVCQPPRFKDPKFPDKVYKVEKALKELCTEFEKIMHKKFQMSSMGELTFFLGLKVTHKDDEIFISQDKYMDEILKKFGFSTVKTASTPIETSKPLLKYENAKDVDVHLYKSMIGSLMYLTASRPNIIFVVCSCVRFEVIPKVLHLHAMKKIFRYLKGQPKLGLWYLKDSPFDLEAYTDSDYASASLDMKSIIGGCQFLRSRLISWQCKKQTVVANSTTKSEYVAAASCCGQVLWIQNKMLDYGYNFINTKIFIDNESIIYVVKNPVFHSKTKHIEIRYHFIRDSNKKKLIQMIKIHTD
nr:hypothetical protein [Tanacetum cinerariifolium]